MKTKKITTFIFVYTIRFGACSLDNNKDIEKFL